jgi:hypothetical protein
VTSSDDGGSLTQWLLPTADDYQIIARAMVNTGPYFYPNLGIVYKFVELS